MNNIIIIAADFNGTINNTPFWDTGLGKILGTMMGVVGILVVIYGIMKGVKNVASGKVADAVKGIVGAILLAAVLFNPTLIENAIRAGGKVINSAIETVASIGESGSKPTAPSGTPGSTTPGATTPPTTTAPAGATPPPPAATS
jgi:hypothetical protein